VINSCSVIIMMSSWGPELTELFRNYKFVGCVDQTRSLVQYSVSEV